MYVQRKHISQRQKRTMDYHKGNSVYKLLHYSYRFSSLYHDTVDNINNLVIGQLHSTTCELCESHRHLPDDVIFLCYFNAP